ncbi:MAG: NAD(P)H-hydrate dehydratase [Haliscomenobacter sp.]|nr:NAD(P)H-hydrate dehydratase [Haliscomenobacter sp.]
MKILLSPQIREADQYTIRQEPIASIDLMERAAAAFVQWFERRFSDTSTGVTIVCGTGNNGGDGLAIARLLCQRFYPVNVILLQIAETLSPDCQVNLQRLPPREAIPVRVLGAGDPLPALPETAILVDAIFGSGLNRPVEGYWAACIEALSNHPGVRISVDLPSGLFADTHSSGAVFRADFTCSFELPKLAFFMPENAPFVGEWEVVPIGLDQSFINQAETPYFYTRKEDVQPLLKRRARFAHKGQFGHALLFCGSYGMMGAAILSSRACLRSGVGLLTVHTPQCGYSILQSTVPEAMAHPDRHELHWTENPSLQGFDAVGAGCGIGKQAATLEALRNLLRQASQPLVLDADALNLIAANSLIPLVPKGSILTPHPKEFERMFGPSSNDFERLALLREQAVNLGCVIALKGAFTEVCSPEGEVWFNGSGNPGMATAGSGDVLTGILTGLLAQGYPAWEAARLGVFLHGLAGDLAAERLGHNALLAGDLVDHLGYAFQNL